jgi:hypothetical protein
LQREENFVAVIAVIFDIGDKQFERGRFIIKSKRER